MNVMSAIICGFTLAYVEVFVCLKGISQIFEQPMNYPIEWRILSLLVIVGYLITYLGTKIAVTRINKKTVANIVKMK